MAYANILYSFSMKITSNFLMNLLGLIVEAQKVISSSTNFDMVIPCIYEYVKC
jgi:hypothetical protein